VQLQALTWFLSLDRGNLILASHSTSFSSYVVRDIILLSNDERNNYMPQIDLTVTVSVIIALCAIISPILTAIINNKFQLKLRKLELQQKHFEDTVMYKRKIFEGYPKYAGKCVSDVEKGALPEYGEYYLLALMYAPSEIQSDMEDVHNLIIHYRWGDAVKILEGLVPRIHAMLQSL
jgi:hypothetical protein